MAELAEGASLLRTYRTKSYREFESRSSRCKDPESQDSGFLFYCMRYFITFSHKMGVFY